MPFTENIKLVVDVVTGNAKSSLSSLKSDVSEAEGAFGKLKAGAGGAFDILKSSPALAAGGIAAAGAAIGTFAAKSITAFQDTALAAGKFADATGLSVDDASRLIEVAGDIGVSADTVQSALGKMEKAIGSNPQKFRDLGIQIRYAADGTVDVKGTFLNAVDALNRIEDPAKRAATAAQIFGKGWQGMAELLAMSSDQIVTAMGNVDSAKAINEDELRRAREFRDLMDSLRDAMERVSITAGGALVDGINQASQGWQEFTDRVKPWWESSTAGLRLVVAGWQALHPEHKQAADEIGKLDSVNKIMWAGWKKSAEDAANATKQVPTAIDAITTSASAMGSAMGPAATSIGDYTRASQDATSSANDFGGSADAIAENLGHETDALRAANDALAAHTNAQLAAFDATFAVKDATDQFAKAHLAAIQTEQDATKSSGEKTQAYDNETQAAEKVAVSIQKKAEQDAIASGTALTAKQSNDILIGALQTLASQSSGPTAAALQTLIGKLQETGAQKPQPTVTLNDKATAPVDAVQTKLAVLGRTTATAAIHADDNTAVPFANAQARGNAWAGKVFTATIATRTQGMQVLGGSNVAVQAKAMGGEAHGVTLLGEEGPELVDLPTGSFVHTAEETKRMMAQGIPGPDVGLTPNVVIHMPPGTSPTSVAQAIERYRLRNGTR